MKAMYKSELARAAGVSVATLRRWMSKHREALRQLGVEPEQKLMPPRAVRYVCEEYGINEEDLAP